MLKLDIERYTRTLLPSDDPAYANLLRSYLQAYGHDVPVLSAASYYDPLTVTVPAGKVTADMSFHLKVPVTGDDLLVTDAHGNHLSHEQRDGVVFFRCDLKALQDNVFIVHGGEHA